MMALIRAVVSIPELRPFRLAVLEVVLVVTVTMLHLDAQTDRRGARPLTLTVHQAPRGHGLILQVAYPLGHPQHLGRRHLQQHLACALLDELVNRPARPAIQTQLQVGLGLGQVLIDLGHGRLMRAGTRDWARGLARRSDNWGRHWGHGGRMRQDRLGHSTRRNGSTTCECDWSYHRTSS